MSKRKASRPASAQPSLPRVPPPEMKGPQTSAQALAAPKPQRPGGELFIVDNADEQWKVAQYLQEWCDIARSLDIKRVALVVQRSRAYAKKSQQQHGGARVELN